MRVDRRQVAALLRLAWRLDLRSQGAIRSHGRRRLPYPFLVTLGFYLFLGVSLGAGLGGAGIPLRIFATCMYAAAGILVAGNILLEYQEILFAPADGDVLFWRPIESRTLFVAKLLHLLGYVSLLSLALLAAPAVFAALGADRLGVLGAFAVAGFGSNLLVAAATILLYAALLRRTAPERFQDVLAYAQLGFMILLFVGYQGLPPIVQRMQQGGMLPGAWLAALPPRWFAALPEAAALGWSPGRLGLAALGILSLGAAGGLAVGRLAPRYEETVERAVSSSPAGPGRRSLAARLQSLAGGIVAREPVRRAGYDFLLANLQGDRKTKVALLSSVALPLAFLAYAFLSGRSQDPYAAAGAAPVQEQVPLYSAVYMLAMLGVSLVRLLPQSSHWRAGWIFHAAPLRRFDMFYSGVLWGLAYGILLPCISAMALALLVAWRDPLHVAAHLAPPVGVCLVVVAIPAFFGVEPPFSCEPQRHGRAAEIVLGLVVTTPVWIVGIAHFLLRRHPGLLIAAGVLLVLVAAALWRLASARLRGALLRRAFDA